VCHRVEDLNFASLLFGLICACEIEEEEREKTESKEMKFPSLGHSAYRHVVSNKIARQ
jgi:hypothetical protein